MRRTFITPGDAFFSLRIGWFLFVLPRRMSRVALPVFLDELARSPRPTSAYPEIALQRIIRLRRPWLALPLAGRNTCYTRALCVYRFLDPGAGHFMRMHFGVETGADPTDRLRGHAWVTLDGNSLEPPEPVVAGRVREIYAHPSGNRE